MYRKIVISCTNNSRDTFSHDRKWASESILSKSNGLYNAIKKSAKIGYNSSTVALSNSKFSLPSVAVVAAFEIALQKAELRLCIVVHWTVTSV